MYATQYVLMIVLKFYSFDAAFKSGRILVVLFRTLEMEDKLNFLCGVENKRHWALHTA